MQPPLGIGTDKLDLIWAWLQSKQIDKVVNAVTRPLGCKGQQSKLTDTLFIFHEDICLHLPVWTTMVNKVTQLVSDETIRTDIIN